MLQYCFPGPYSSSSMKSSRFIYNYSRVLLEIASEFFFLISLESFTGLLSTFRSVVLAEISPIVSHGILPECAPEYFPIFFSGNSSLLFFLLYSFFQRISEKNLLKFFTKFNRKPSLGFRVPLSIPFLHEFLMRFLLNFLLGFLGEPPDGIASRYFSRSIIIWKQSHEALNEILSENPREISERTHAENPRGILKSSKRNAVRNSGLNQQEASRDLVFIYSPERILQEELQKKSRKFLGKNPDILCQKPLNTI